MLGKPWGKSWLTEELFEPLVAIVAGPGVYAVGERNLIAGVIDAEKATVERVPELFNKTLG
jgi:hypothetical protein